MLNDRSRAIRAKKYPEALGASGQQQREKEKDLKIERKSKNEGLDRVPKAAPHNACETEQSSTEKGERARLWD